MKINILGAVYTIQDKTVKQDDFLSKCDGYCDFTTHKIVIALKKPENELDNFEAYKKKVLRHEIIHAFMNESGLQGNWKHSSEWGHDETVVDWFAIQGPKIYECWIKAGAI